MKLEAKMQKHPFDNEMWIWKWRLRFWLVVGFPSVAHVPVVGDPLSG